MTIGADAGKGEQTPPTLGTELGKEPTSPELTSPSEKGAEETFSREQYDKALSEAATEAGRLKDEAVKSAKAEVQSAKDKEIAELQAQRQTEGLATQEAKEIEQWGDTPEVKSFHEERRKHLAREQTFKQKQAEHFQMFSVYDARIKADTAKQLATQYGVDEKELLEAQNPAEMETKAAKLGYEKIKQGSKPPEKIDSSTPSTTGQSWRDKSPDEILKLGVAEKKK